MSALAVVGAALGPDDDAWLVGGGVRDRILGVDSDDLDLAVGGDPERAARSIARAAGRGAAVFRLSDAFGAWRVVGPGGAWQADLSPLQGGSIEADLGQRDLTINAMAQSLHGDDVIDPFGGRADLEARVARAVSDGAFAADPLRTLRVVRFATQLGLAIEPRTAALAREQAPGLAGVAGERIFAELRGIVTADAVVRGMTLLDELALTAHVLPELAAMRGVEQNRYHAADVHGHTLDVLAETVALQRHPAATLGDEHAAAVGALLAEPLADGLTRGDALRLGALLHDAAKPLTQVVGPGGSTIGFPGHDSEGDALSRDVLRRLRASDRLAVHVGALARHHLALGFLVYRQPLERRDVVRYLRQTEPVEVDVTLLSIVDRLATRGDNAGPATAKHLALARTLLGDALRWRAGETRPRPLLRGDELAAELGIAPGPELGRLLRELADAQFAGEVGSREEAIAAARALLG